MSPVIFECDCSLYVEEFGFVLLLPYFKTLYLFFTSLKSSIQIIVNEWMREVEGRGKKKRDKKRREREERKKGKGGM